jgi:hypothetical protein
VKKTILVILIAVLTATPCLAQEIEPEGMFSLHGTVWEFQADEIWDYPPTGAAPMCPLYPLYAFYKGKVYMKDCRDIWFEVESLFYLDLIGVSVMIPRFSFSPFTFCSSIRMFFPNGNGMGYYYEVFLLGVSSALYIYTLEKVEDNWTPPEVE